MGEWEVDNFVREWIIEGWRRYGDGWKRMGKMGRMEVGGADGANGGRWSRWSRWSKWSKWAGWRQVVIY
ncbi:hypothetical protein [Paenibacillus odorifer]|uniref:hypothetical protein n=1 Tax=Paenibacillus odorifer TaxID=189426 RepID=UPI0014700F47|nr:hypothetical protein [Paenibacillus odorifer]